MTNEEIVKHLTAIDSRCKSNTHRLDEVEAKQDDLGKLVSCVASIQSGLEYTKEDVKEIKSDVKELMSIPADRWNAIVKALVTGAAGVLVGALLALIIKGG